MPSLELRPQGNYRIVFRYRGKKYSRSLHTKCEHTAQVALNQVEMNLRHLKIGILSVNPDQDLVGAILLTGTQKRRIVKGDRKRSPQQRKKRERGKTTVSQILDQYIASIKPGTIEKGTLGMLEIHKRHFARLLGETITVGETKSETLQGYIDQRAGEPGRGSKGVSPTTIKKEIATFLSAWKWAQSKKLAPRRDLRFGLQFEKVTQKPPFQTMRQIKRRIARSKLNETEQAELWECLFLTLDEIEAFLKFAKKNARHKFIYPMLAFAAHTGARRSEIIRSHCDDLDFESMTITIHEKKRVKGQQSTRTVPMSNFLAKVLGNWLSEHPGGVNTFCIGIPCTELSPKQAEHHFKMTVKDSDWQNLRGYHVFRHSFCSNSAAKGVDQRQINAWVGHQTEEMTRRYQHLRPNRDAIESVFG